MDTGPAGDMPDSIEWSGVSGDISECSKVEFHAGYRINALTLESQHVLSRATERCARAPIYVNLDFPQLAAAKGGRSVEDPIFLRLAYEVAFAEYAVAVASELNNRGEFLEPSDAIVEIRERINAVARQAAPLYAAQD